MIRRVARIVFVPLIVVTVPIAIVSCDRTMQVEFQVSTNRYVTAQAYDGRLNVLIWTFTGGFEHAQREIASALHTKYYNWFPQTRHRGGSGSDSFPSGIKTSWSHSIRTITCELWGLIFILATYPLLVPVLAFLCRCRRRGRMPIPVYLMILFLSLVIYFVLNWFVLATLELLMDLANVRFGMKEIIQPIAAIVVLAWGGFRVLGWMMASADLGRCVGCGYSLIGNVSGVCPECGTRIEFADEKS